ncbi:uncharacterized protein LOC127079541 [Lathyrus oleraceus]|uniref:uncharacterized protein LOC127079541 n=1 Tax=Pisum sativum TaxID=3888 RepID=UPI0021CEAC4B|nr:uncharacterized protein LOC127079541 [Pisum sativum]
MLKDCIEFAKGCQECQIHAGIQHAPASELHAIIKPWPFRGWALDLIGEIRPNSSKGQRFGIPESITTDQGSVFTGRKMQVFVKEMGKKPKNWHKTLDQALWACRTSPKEATNTTPFQLTFGHDAVLPVEIYLQSVRIQRQGEIQSDLYWEMMMNELVDLDEERLHALEVLRRQKERVARAYNKRVKGKTFTMNDLVWKVILLMDRKNKTLGKWYPHWEGPFRILKAFSNNAYEIEELTEDRRILKVNGKYLKKYKPFVHEVKIITT